MQPGSLKVKVGDAVKTGQVLGLLGNTGNTDGAHLHFHIMDGPSPLLSNGLPFVFTHFTGEGRVTDGQALQKFEVAPVDTSALTGTHDKEMPLNLEVVAFGEYGSISCAAMAAEIDLAPRHGPFAGTLDPAAIDQYAAATNDTNAPVATGTAVPATFPVILSSTRSRRPTPRCRASVYESGRNGVHGEHEVLLHRPLVPGETLETFSEPFAVRNTQRRRARRAAHGAVRRRRRARGRALVDHLLPRLRRARRRGAGAPRPHVPRRGPRAPGRLGRRSTSTSTPPTRYAEVSNDWSAHHFDLESGAQGRASTTCSRTGSARWRCARRRQWHGRRR